MDHLLVLAVYGACLCVVALFTKPGRSIKYFTLFLSLFCLKLAIALIIDQNNEATISDIRLYSLYDAAGNYADTFYMLDHNLRVLFPILPPNAADAGYNTLLYWIGEIYRTVFAIDQPDYLLFLYSNVFFATLLSVAILHYLSTWRLLGVKSISGAGVLLVLGEPMLLAFGAVLEREIVVGLIALLTFVSFMENRWVRFAIGSVLLFFFRSAYAYLLPTIVLVWLAFLSVQWFRKHLLVTAALVVLLFGAGVQVLTIINPVFSDYMFRHIMNDTANLEGFGGYIQRLPRGLSVIAYSVLGFVSPVPAYSMFDSRVDGFNIFGGLVGLGSVSYCACILIVAGALKRLRDVAHGPGPIEPADRALAQAQFLFVAKGLIVVLISQLVFQGFLYNVRHKVQIIPFLLVLTLYALQFLKTRPGRLRVLMLRQVAWAVCLIVGLNLVYVIARFGREVL